LKILRNFRFVQFFAMKDQEPGRDDAAGARRLEFLVKRPAVEDSGRSDRVR
jgi:hypothetical protein